MTHLRPLTLSLALMALLAGPARSQSLAELYESARGFDAAYQSALARHDATLARSAQSKAGLLPSVNASAGVTRSQNNYSMLPSTFNSTTETAGINASQPLYRPANTASYEQGRKQEEIAQAQLTSAEQDLIVRVSQAYFDVLGAQDNLTFVQAQKTAVEEQLAAAKRNFEVGTTTITDTREAQARYDLVLAQEIAAENDLRVKKLALDQLVGKAGTQPLPLASPVVLPPLQPNDVNAWVQQSETMHPAIQQARLGLDVARLETRKAEAGHKPTLDLTAGYNVSRYPNGMIPFTAPGQSFNTRVASVGVSFNLPLFAGFATQNRIRETVALEEQARSDFEGTQRAVSLNTRSAFLGVQAGMSQVKALEAAEASSQSALDANKLGYQVGVRINIDVLNSQSQLYQTKRDLAKARYDVLVAGLRLRQAAGTLKPDDLQAVNSLLAK